MSKLLIRQPVIRSDPKIAVQPVQGMMPDSVNEFLVAWALDKLRIAYRYQVPVGVYGTRGSQVVDFIVYAPWAIPVFVQGAHWHTRSTATEDSLKQAAARNRFGAEPILLTEEETDSYDHALATVKKYFAQG